MVSSRHSDGGDLETRSPFEAHLLTHLNLVLVRLRLRP